jgi:hypothetical protein
MKKKFKDTKVGKFLKEKAPNLAGDILSITGDITGVEALKNIGDKIKGSNELSDFDKELALKELDLDIKEAEEVSKRWSADMISDSWLSKNVRPLTLLYLLLVFSILVICDSIENTFEVKAGWVSLIESLLITVVVAYFGGRSYEKGKKIK